MMIFGYLRETKEKAIAAGKDPKTGLPRTGLDEYLAVIFPEVTDWVHDKAIGNGCKKRPDYRSETLKMIIEFDGLNHYQKPDIILNDIKAVKYYSDLGYKVIRIPYFIQLTNTAVKTLFNRDVDIQLFDNKSPSLIPEDCCSPAFLCPLGIYRMKEDFKKFPDQLKVNLDYLKSYNNNLITGVDYLEKDIIELDFQSFSL